MIAIVGGYTSAPGAFINDCAHALFSQFKIFVSVRTLKYEVS